MTDHPERLKLYIVLRDDLSPGFAVNSAAHASCGAVVEWLQLEREALNSFYENTQALRPRKPKNIDIVHSWLEKSFKKCCVVATAEQFELIKVTVPDIHVFSENDLEGKECAIACKPRYQWPEILRGLPLYGSET